MATTWVLLSFLTICRSKHDIIPVVPLYNAAKPDTLMPVVGLGTGGYVNGRSPQAKPEHWNVSEGFLSTLKWFSLGGKRWDSAYSYESALGVARGLLNATNNWTTTQREDIWITSKLGSGAPLGYNDTLLQHANILRMFNTTYVDLLLIHTPSDNTSGSDKSTDVYCNGNNALYDATICRQHTWKAMEFIFNTNGATAIGVSNYEKKHLMDIFNMNSLIPAVNQFEFHGYWHEYDLVEFCQLYDIQVNSYAPLGTPDIMYGDWQTLLTQHPVAIAIGDKYKKSAAQVWLKWGLQQRIVVNPRSWNISHQQENMQLFDFELNQNDMLQLASITAPTDNKVCPDFRYWD